MRRLRTLGFGLLPLTLALPLVLSAGPAYAADSTAVVRGGVMPVRGAAEVVVPLVNVQPAQPSGSNATDQGGRYTYHGTSASLNLDGPSFDLSDSCSPANGTGDSGGNITVGPSTGPDCASGGPTTRAGRTATYYANLGRLLVLKWQVASTWTSSAVPLQVNLSTTACGFAWSNGSQAMQLQRSGSGCANTGEVADAVLWAYRLGLDDNDTNGTQMPTNTRTAYGDVFAVTGSRDPCVAPGSAASGETPACSTSVRDVRTNVTTTNVTTACPSGGGTFGRASACESHLISGAVWDLVGPMVSRYGTEEGWRQIERLTLATGSVTNGFSNNTTGNAGCASTNSYQAMLAADDDNGNLSDGTPNADLIYTAFNNHGIACQTGSHARNQTTCVTPPGQPVVTIKNETGSARLTWPAISGATSYQVLRRVPSTGFKALLPLGTTTSPSYLDSQVAPGLGYEYEVVATAGSCTSRYTTTTAFTPSSDTVAPTNPTLTTATKLNRWGNDPTVDVQFSGASDTGGSGLAGYSFQWSTSPSTVPDTSVDVPAAATGTTSPTLLDGPANWFHLRTVDGAGNASGTVHLGPFKIDTVAPSGVAITSDLPVFSLVNQIPIAWTAADAASGIATYDVWSRAAQSGSDFKASVPFRVDTQDTSDTFVGSPGHTHCLSVAATDAAGNAAASAEKCTAMPLRAASLGRTGKWKQRSSAASYQGVYLESTKKRSSLNAVVQGKHIGIVVTTCPTCGKVVVKLGHKVLERLNLKSATTVPRKLIMLASYPSLKSGTLSIKVRSKRKPVRIEGLAISRV